MSMGSLPVSARRGAGGTFAAGLRGAGGAASTGPSASPGSVGRRDERRDLSAARSLPYRLRAIRRQRLRVGGGLPQFDTGRAVP
jgi:hypothetical protein